MAGMGSTVNHSKKYQRQTDSHTAFASPAAPRRKDVDSKKQKDVFHLSPCLFRGQVTREGDRLALLALRAAQWVRPERAAGSAHTVPTAAGTSL